MAGSKERLQALDCARGLAILAVFACHSLGVSFFRVELPWGTGWFRDFSVDHSLLALLPLTLGWTGVAIFFAVSGFCIHLSFLSGRPGDWRGFFIRRIFRIYPPYLLALVFFAFVITPSRLSIMSIGDLAQFGSHVMLVHNLDSRSYFGINPAFWSIAVEAQLYLLYPVLFFLARKAGWQRALWCVGILEIVMRGGAGIYLLHAGVRIPRWMIGLPFFYWFGWSAGAAVADAYAHGRPLPFRAVPPTMWLLLVVVSSHLKPLSEFTFLFTALWATAVIARQLSTESTVPVFRYVVNQLLWLGVFDYGVLLTYLLANGASPVKPLAVYLAFCVGAWVINTVMARWEAGPVASVPRFLANQLRFLGLCSYSFYLLHMPIVVVVPVVLQKLGLAPSGSHASLLTFGACMLVYPVILGVSWVYYRWIELPSIATGKSLIANLGVARGIDSTASR